MGTNITNAMNGAADRYRREQLPLDRIAADRAQSERRAQDIRQAEANRMTRVNARMGSTQPPGTPPAPVDRRTTSTPKTPSPWGAA